MNTTMPDDEYEEERLNYMWYVSYTENSREPDPFEGRIEVNTPRSNYSRFWCTLEYTHGSNGWISAKRTYSLEEMR